MPSSEAIVLGLIPRGITYLAPPSGSLLQQFFSTLDDYEAVKQRTKSSIRVGFKLAIQEPITIDNDPMICPTNRLLQDFYLNFYL